MAETNYAQRLASRLLESAGKEGVYYVARFPRSWRLYAFPWEDYGNMFHSSVWHKFLAEELAENWAQKLPVTAEQLLPFWKGFPRGRVERADHGEYTVFHADDLADTGIGPDRVERAFELGNSKVIWSPDPHERQNPKHTAALKQLLGF